MANEITPVGEASIDCTIINGIAARPGQAITFWKVAGHNNMGVQLVGRKSEGTGFRFRLFFQGTETAVYNWVDSILALSGKKCTIVNSANKSFSNCLVVDHEIEYAPHAVVSADANVEAICAIHISGQRFV